MADEKLLTLHELCDRVGISLRNVRFYASRGLVPPPIRKGRSGYYSRDHVGRLELVQELQSHGFTLSAIEKYVAGIPADATPEDLALARTMLAPWDVERPIEMSRGELSTRAGRELTDDDLRTLAALGVVFPLKRGQYQVAVSQLSVGLGLLDLGSRSRRRSRPPTCTPGTAARSPRSSTTCSAPWSGRSTATRAPRPRPCARSWRRSSRSRSRPSCRRTKPDGRDQARRHRTAQPLMGYQTVCT